MPVEIPNINNPDSHINYGQWSTSPGLIGNAAEVTIEALAMDNFQDALNLRYLRGLKALDELTKVYSTKIPTDSTDIKLLVSRDITANDELKIQHWKKNIIKDIELLELLPDMMLDICTQNLPIMKLNQQGIAPSSKIEYAKMLLIEYIKFDYHEFISKCYDILTEWYCHLSNHKYESSNNELIQAAISAKLLPDKIWISILNHRAKNNHNAYYVDTVNYHIMHKIGIFHWQVKHSSLNKLFPIKKK